MGEGPCVRDEASFLHACGRIIRVRRKANAAQPSGATPRRPVGRVAVSSIAPASGSSGYRQKTICRPAEKMKSFCSLDANVCSPVGLAMLRTLSFEEYM